MSVEIACVICCCASYPGSDVMKDEWLFSADVIGEALSSSGHDVSRLTTPFAGRPLALGTISQQGCLSPLRTSLMAYNFFCLGQFLRLDEAVFKG